LPEEPNASWDRALPIHPVIEDSAVGIEFLAEKTILLTGAAGSIGAALAKKILSGNPLELLLLDHSEQAVYELGRELSGRERTAACHFAVGDSGDPSLLHSLFTKHRPQLILHTAAYKHVPLMEENPFAAVQNNAIGTWELAKAAAEQGVPQLILVSTDKAANPRSILGASKRIAEQAVSRWSGSRHKYASIRLVNVLGSAGSVAPLFQEQIRRGGPVTITHPDAERHFLTLEDTVHLILIAAALRDEGTVYIPQISKPMKIAELAKILIQQAEAGPIAAKYIGLRDGEKLTEDLVSAGETLEPAQHPAVQKVKGVPICAGDFDRRMDELKDAVRRRDLDQLLETVCNLAPDYQPSGKLCPVQRVAHD
jgi:FlaA1/EpsC-like NDP-sugar epimerase